MNPTAFTILGLEIKWYGILIATGMLLGLFVANYTCKIRKVNYDDLLTAVLIILPISFIGSRLYYVIFNYENYHSFIDVINIREGGLAIHGGIITAIITTLVYCKIKKFRFLDFADVAAPSIILAQALGRWGNFFNGE
ncbi:prolipoprotein diacylglyceryl transferase family protein, partial [uncultured Clostridium sp.]|uniref:prolipoprotein diacylglyceryl transferase family protein n=1 Tax=uncultured Clostridium sp. TaxID=59620 RepID=UPI0025D6D2DB